MQRCVCAAGGVWIGAVLGLLVGCTVLTPGYQARQASGLTRHVAALSADSCCWRASTRQRCLASRTCRTPAVVYPIMCTAPARCPHHASVRARACLHLEAAHHRTCCKTTLPAAHSTAPALQIRLDDPAKYQSIVDAEWNIIYDKLKKCVDSGASIVLSRLAIGEALPAA